MKLIKLLACAVFVLGMTVACSKVEVKSEEATTTEETTTEEPEIPWTEEYLPPLGTVTTTASIALIATTSALLAKPLADLLLKLVKPTVKKVVKKIAKIRGKKEVVLSLRERRLEQSEVNHAKVMMRRLLKGK